jgi:hypothetical protein
MVEKEIDQYRDCEVSFGYTITKPNTDSQGNLIISFDKKQTYKEMLKEKFVKMASSALGSANVSPKFRAFTFKTPIVPTNEEIEEKANTYVRSGDYGDVDMTQSIMSESYQKGYKQALKDLGYEK